MKRINLCWSQLFLFYRVFISAPAVFAATMQGDSIKSNPSVVNGGVICQHEALLDMNIETNTLRAKPQQVI